MGRLWIIAACIALAALARADDFIALRPDAQIDAEARNIAMQLNIALAQVDDLEPVPIFVPPTRIPGLEAEHQKAAAWFALAALREQLNGIEVNANVQPELPTGDEVFDDPVFYVQRRGTMTDAQMRNQIRIALQKSGDVPDMWAWRDSAEEKLFALGTDATSALQTELAARNDSLEADAIAVVLFRLENQGVNPNEMLREWGKKRFEGPDPATLKITHVIDNKQAANLRELFPHHIFYVVENPKDKTRAVVALAADGKVQPIEDDAALAKFLRSEGGTQADASGKRRISAAAAMLATARAVSTSQPLPRVQNDSAEAYSAILDADGVSINAIITFAADGKLESIKTTQTGTPTTTTASPTTAPAIPRGRRGGPADTGEKQPVPAVTTPIIID